MYNQSYTVQKQTDLWIRDIDQNQSYIYGMIWSMYL